MCVCVCVWRCVEVYRAKAIALRAGPADRSSRTPVCQSDATGTEIG